jgi:two-component system cell cycle sensor histidine kinase/response regulator CckA
VTKVGKEIIVKSLWSLVRDPAGQPEAILIVNTDITEKKKLEAQFLRAQRLESIGALASGIAHDLNNVLAPILIGVPFLKEQIKDKSCLKILSAMESSASRGAGVVKQVLTFARGATVERMALQPQPLIHEICKIIRETFPKSIQIKTELDHKLWDIEGDSTQIHQVLLNLCVNARDAMPPGGTLTIGARNVNLEKPVSRAGLAAMPGPYVEIKIVDTGMGIPADIQDNIFQPFFTTKAVNKGTGLGLSTTVSILQSHGGLIGLESAPGKGTTFFVWFPAKTPAGEIEPPSKIASVPSGGHELILLVDDEVAIREMCKLMLESCDYRVMTAENGAEALAVLDRHKDEISAVIIDMIMPVMDGATAVRAMRWSTPNLKIIATSGLSEKEQSNSSDIKADRFLQKPYTAEQLLMALSSLLVKKG